MSSVIAHLLREKPIVVTGMGSFSAAGESVEALWQRAFAGRGLAAWQEFVSDQGSFRFAVCAAPEVDVSRPELRSVRKLDRCVQMAWMAANEAWGLRPGLADAYRADRVGV
ncbi:MAG: hypothetical protein DLM52_10980 [Chthoniobacterales bacterium]|nr:MAG: hypothetical protein DLM52_10980 [Chthoniobacterales bacterium]